MQARNSSYAYLAELGRISIKVTGIEERHVVRSDAAVDLDRAGDDTVKTLLRIPQTETVA
jgi:hypothetical protein